MMEYTTQTHKMLHIKELAPKVPRYLIMQEFSRSRYIIYHNSQKSDNYFLNMYFYEMTIAYVKLQDAP